MTRSAAKKDLSDQADNIDELRETTKRLEASRIAAENENQSLRAQIKSLMEANEQTLAKRNSSVNSEPQTEDVSTLTIDAGVQSHQINTETRDSPGQHSENIAYTSDIPRNTNVNNSRLDHSRCAGSSILEGLISQMSQIQNTQINACLPTYDGRNGNPAEFLDNLNEYFIKRNIVNEDRKLQILRTR